MPALRKGILSGVWMGILAVFGAYVMAEELAAGRNFVRFHFGGVTENCTVSMVLGNGSLAVELAVLAWIFSGTLVAILGTHVRKKAEENIERAYSDLFQAKRIKRKRKKE